MDINNIEEITIEGARQLYNGSHIGNDLLLIDDINKVPLPNEPQRMKCILLAYASTARRSIALTPRNTW